MSNSEFLNALKEGLDSSETSDSSGDGGIPF
jgi:hypothetical protein